MQSQQSQIDALKRENADKDAKLAAAQQSAQGRGGSCCHRGSQADALSTSLSSNTGSRRDSQRTVTDIKSTNIGLAQTLSDTKKSISDQLDNPLALRYKGITIHASRLLCV